MGYRKIIGFGGSSYVVSLPKEWVSKNGLKKGDDISVEEHGNLIKISPAFLKQSDNNKEINVEFDGNLKRLKAQLVYAYINNFNTININGSGLFKFLPEIRKLNESLIALEIIQQTPQRIVLKDFLNVHDVSVHDTLRRIDRIILSMAEDVKVYLLGKSTDTQINLEQKEIDVNRLSNLLFKILKRGFSSNDRAILKLDLDEIMYYWELTLFVEKIGDQLKRIPRQIKPGTFSELVGIFDSTFEQYKTAMKANFSLDYELAITILTRKKNIYNDIEKLAEKTPNAFMPSLEKIKNINNYACNIAKVLLKLKSQETKK